MNIQVQTTSKTPFKLRYGNFIGGQWVDRSMAATSTTPRR